MKCSMAHRYTGRRCSRPAVHKIEVGCVHEHIYGGAVCSYHIVVVREQLEVTCDPCSTGPDAHECPLIGREVTA
ncbi:MAG TPA: hypothetical protein VF158_04800 [Longimicrobiales bacterium]